MTVNQSQKLIRFEESIPETKLVAIIRQEPSDIIASQQLKFIKSFDDLDYLTYAVLSLPSGNRVSLVRHQNSPQPGTEICVNRNLDTVTATIEEMLIAMNLTLKDLTWIHPEYEFVIDTLARKSV